MDDGVDAFGSHREPAQEYPDFNTPQWREEMNAKYDRGEFNADLNRWIVND